MHLMNKFGRILAMTLSLVVLISMPDLVSAQAPGGSTPSVSGAVPTNAVYPAITGTARVPNSLTASRGTWGNTPTSFLNAWYRCTSAAARATAKPASCTLVEGQSGSTYVLSASDVGKFIVAAVTATNASGSLTRWSASTAVVIAQYLPPVNTVAPVVSGNKIVSQTLAVTNGTWTESPASYSYKWFRCTATKAAANSLPAGCTEIVGQTSSTYTLITSDAAKFMVAAVTATNQLTSVTKWSASTTVVAALARPANTVAPIVTGTSTNSFTLTSTTGTWTNHPTLTYQWVRCTARVSAASNTMPSACSNIAGATSSTYALTDSDVAKFVGVTVTGTNAIGVASKWSATTATAVAALPAPANTATPVVSGSAQVSRVLTLSNGTWNFRPTGFTYKWYSCKATKAASATRPTGCTQIAGATSSRYQLLPAQGAKFVLGSVTATNGSGSTERFTSTTRIITTPAPYSPVIYEAPSLASSILPFLSDDVYLQKGLWLGYPLPEVIDATWYRCSNASEEFSFELPADCEEIPITDGAPTFGYQIGADDVGKHILASVVSRNNEGFVEGFTQSLGPVLSPPINSSIPTISGSTEYNALLEIEQGTWSAWPSAQFEYSWFRCDFSDLNSDLNDSDACDLIEGASESRYLTGDDDVGRFVYGQVEATNEYGVSLVATTSVGPMSDIPLPVLTNNLEITGVAVSGNSAEISIPAWENSPTATGYFWVRCSTEHDEIEAELPNGCSLIEGESSRIYALQDEDAGMFVWGAAFADNRRGRTTVLRSLPSAIAMFPSIQESSIGIEVQGFVGESLNIDPLTVSGHPQPSVSVSWYRCTEGQPQLQSEIPADCNAIAQQADQTYTLGWDDSGYYVGARVVASNSAGTVTRFATSSMFVRSHGSVVSSGYRHTCARVEGQFLYCWGLNSSKQVGNTSATVVFEPRLVSQLSQVRSVSVGYSQSCALTGELPSLYCWGSNDWGNFGNGSLVSSSLPQLISGINPTSISQKYDSMCAVMQSSEVKCWGRGDFGQLGNGSATSRVASPVTYLNSLSSTVASSGQMHSCVVKSGQVWCVGREQFGALGDSTIHSAYQSNTPRRAGTLAGVTAVSAGQQHTCAISNGSVWCWGYNVDGQVGVPSGEMFDTPMEVLGNAVEIETYGNVSCALTTEMTVYCWGLGSSGAMGRGLNLSQSTPQQVSGIDNAFDISVGENFACAALRGGGLKCWGANNQGQMADYTSLNRNLPVSIAGLPPVG